MKKILLVISFLIFLFLTSFADDFYWVNNGGNWSDFTNHWATTSGGSTMHTRLPNSTDNVYFDANSFTSTDQVVTIDTSYISCGIMNWANVSQYPEFLGGASDTLVITQKLILQDKDLMSFNVLGQIVFEQSTSGQTLIFQPNNNVISADIFVDIELGFLDIQEDLNMRQNRLTVYNGQLNLNNHNLYVRHFNAGEDLSVSADVSNPSLKDIDTLFCSGSIHFVDALDLSEFSGLILLESGSVDSNYAFFDNHSLNSDFIFSTNKKYFLLSNLNTTKSVLFPMSGEFYSQDFDITCDSITSIGALNRKIDLGTSNISTSNFIVSKTGLTLISDNSNLIFTGVDDFTFSTNKDDIIFKNLSVISPNILFWDGNIQTGNVTLVAGSKLFLEENSVLEFDNLVANGDCGNYIELRSICSENGLNNEFCVNILPVFRSTGTITVDFLILSNVEADGDFTANNSIDEGGNTGWTINESTTISTLYWVGNEGDWNNKNNWSTTSGGATHTCIPSKSTNVVFDAASFDADDTVHLDDFGYCASMTWVGLTTNPIFAGEGNLFVSDSILLHPFLDADFSGNIYLQNSNVTDIIPIQTAGVEINAKIIIEGTATWDFIDLIKINNDLIFNEGGLAFSGNDLIVNNFISNTNKTRDLNINSTSIQLMGDDNVWDFDASNLTLSADSSNIYILNNSATKKEFNGADLQYYNLYCNSDFVQINGSNTLNILTIPAGNTVAFEGGTTTQIDSLDAAGSCDLPVSITSELSDFPATIKKSGYNILSVDNFFIKNIVADITGGELFEANQSLWSGNVTDWIFNDTILGKTFYWLGNTSKWNDIENWQVDGAPAICLPTINDTVIIDPVIFATATTDSIKISRNAYCHDFIATGLNSKNLNVYLSQNLYVASSFLLSDSVDFNYFAKPKLPDVNNYGVFIIPDTVNSSINTQLANINVNLYLNPTNINDTVFLESNLLMDTIASLNVLSGVFDAQNKLMKCGLFQTTSQASKNINIKNTDIQIFKDLKFQDNSLLTFYSDSSLIEFKGNSTNFSIFDGGSQRFFNVKFSGNTSIDKPDLLTFILGSNTYDTLFIYDGVNTFVETGTTQQVDSALVITGTCQNYVHLNSSEKGVQCTFNSDNVITDTVTCVIIEDVVINSAVTMLSFDEGNNVGWIFNATQAATADFSIPYPACLEAQLTFANNSTSMYGGNDNLEFEWELNDSISDIENLLYTFENEGEYIISLLSTDTITGCNDLFVDTLTIYNHNVNITSSEPGLEICQGETVDFTATSNNATEFYFFLNDVFVDLGDPSINVYSTDSLANNDEIRVETIYEGCSKTSDTLVFTVNPSPVVALHCSELDTTICDGGFISFDASGAEMYEFYLNNVSVSSYSITSTYGSNTLSDQDYITVMGQSAAGCFAASTNQYTVTVLVNPTITILPATDPPTICSGDTLRINSSGANEYEFFLNGISTAPSSTQDFYESDSLINNDVITAIGIDTESCSSLSNQIKVTVNVSPEPILTTSEPDETICIGDDVSFLGNGANEYEFFVDGVSQGAFSSSNSFNTNALTNFQTISLLGRIGTCVRSADSLTFNVFPVIELNASEISICPDETITFTASGDTIYQFFVDGNPVTTLSANPVFSTSTLTNGQIVTVEGTVGSCLPDPIVITVNSLPTTTLECSEADTSICVGDEITFIASGADEYEFFIDGVSQAPPSSLTFFSSSTITNGQEITVVGYSKFGCNAYSNNSFVVTVNNYPNVTLVAENTTTKICQGENLLFTASGADEYQFLISNVPQGTYSNTSTFSTSTLQNGQTISVQGQSNSCAIEAPETFSYTVFPLPNVTLDATTPISICEADTIRFRALGANEYEFFVNSISQGNPTTNNFFESDLFSDLDEITVVGYQNICSANSLDTIVVNVNQLPNLNFTSNIVESGLCYGDTAEFFVTGAMTYQFFLDSLAYGGINTTGSISIPYLQDGQIVTVTGYNNACFNDASNIFEPTVLFVDLNVSTSVDQNSLCAGEPVTIYAEGSDLYEFFLDGASLGASSSLDSTIISNIQNGQYVNVVATDLSNNCSTTSGEFFFQVSDIPEISAVPDVQFCQNDSVLLISNSDLNNQWYLNSDLIFGATDNNYTIFDGGFYSVSASVGSDGGVYSCGANGFGQLGNGSNIQSLTTTQAIIADRIISSSAGKDFVIALDENSNLWVWGNNVWGNLGIGTYAPVYTPVLLESLSGIQDVSAGYQHVIALKNDGTLMSWGQNSFGQLGYGNYASSNFPMPISSISNVIEISAGKSHSLALTADGTIYAWGDNEFGQLGDGTFTNRPSPVLVTGITNAASIATGANHSLAILDDGTVWTWGSNENGQLGTNNYNSSNVPVKNLYLRDISQVAGGLQHSVALNQRGEVYTWGNNLYGQLGTENIDVSLIPQRVDLVGVTDIYCGPFNSYAIRKDESLWAWGQNNYGQLGDQTNENRFVPTRAVQFLGIENVSAGAEFVNTVWASSHSCTSDDIEIIMDTVPDVTIIKNGLVLSTILGQSYQWFFNESPISNSNTQSITITAIGNYSVEVFFENGCSGMSNVYYFTLGIDEWYSENNVKIVPNPNNGSFELELNMPKNILDEITSYKLFSVFGSDIANNNDFKASEKQNLKFDNLASGMYYLILSSSTGSIMKSFVVE